ncbi:MAG: polysaccharide pyruvyl transferase family protein [Ginsengibacter sp.]
MNLRPKLLLIGYSGKRNFGDDLLLKQAYIAFHEITEIHIHTSTLDQNSDYLYSWFPEATIFKSGRLGYKYLKNFTHILQFGGGVFFNYNKIDFKNYWRKRASIIKNYSLVKLSGAHFAGIGIGLGPFADRKTEDLCFRELKNFDFLNVRDQISLELCKTHKYNKVTISEDLSLANYKSFHSFKIPDLNRKERIIICPRKYPHGKNKNQYLKNLFLVCEEFKYKGKEVIVYGLQSCHDEEVVESFSKKGYQTVIWNPVIMNIEDILREFANCQLIITARMHGLYISGIVDVPVIGIGVHPKLKLASQLFSKSLCLHDTFELNEMKEAIQKLIELPENNFEHLFEKENQCKAQYDLVERWLLGNNLNVF